MKRIVIALAAFFGGLVFTGSVLAAPPAPPTLTVSPHGPTAADGVSLAVSSPWKIDSCRMDGDFLLAGTKNGHASAYPTIRTAEMVWNEDPLPEWGDLPLIKASCYVHHTVVSHSRRWRWFTKSRRGIDTSDRAKSGNCFIDGFSGWLRLDCWAGNYAAATYRFHLPSDARRIYRTIRGVIGCCDQGRVTKHWQGNTAHVAVTGWRSYTVKRVKIAYQHRVHVRTVKTYKRDASGTWTGVLPPT